jgi:hypothetical protein
LTAFYAALLKENPCPTNSDAFSWEMDGPSLLFFQRTAFKKGRQRFGEGCMVLGSSKRQSGQDEKVRFVHSCVWHNRVRESVCVKSLLSSESNSKQNHGSFAQV